MRIIQNSIFLTTLLSSLLFFASCKEEDNTQKENQENIIGTWIATEVSTTACEDPDSDASSSLECTSANCLTYQFVSDTTQLFIITTITDGITRNESGIYMVSKSQVSFCAEEEEDGLVCTASDLLFVQDNSIALTMTLTTTSEETGCIEVVTLVKQEEEVEEEG